MGEASHSGPRPVEVDKFRGEYNLFNNTKMSGRKRGLVEMSSRAITQWDNGAQILLSPRHLVCQAT